MNLKDYLKEVKNFPIPGVSFKDISPLLAEPKAYNYAIDEMAKLIGDDEIIVAPDARGFLFGAPVALKADKGFVMIRKVGKLPGKTVKGSYKLEYGNNTLEMIDGWIKKGQKVTIIDDVLATGGTVEAMIDLVESQGGVISKLIFLAELSYLEASKKFSKYDIHSLVTY